MTEFAKALYLNWSRMQVSDVEEVIDIENSVYPYPWSRGNFLESLQSGYEGFVVRDHNRFLLGYMVVMPVVDELHLLNITVHGKLHGRGLGRQLLDRVAALGREKGCASILLEVRPSNTRALKVYQQYGFMSIGRRRGYYPAAGQTREDAIVMRFLL